MSIYWMHDNDTVMRLNSLNYPLIALCGASGAGKSTLARYLSMWFEGLKILTNFTTRPKRESDDMHLFEYLRIEEFSERIAIRQFFLYRQGEIPYYGYAKDEIDGVIEAKKIPVFMFRYTGLEEVLRLFNNVYTLYLEANPILALSHSQDTISNLSLEDERVTNERIVEALSSYGTPFLKIHNTYSLDCFNDKLIKAMIERVFLDVRHKQM